MKLYFLYLSAHLKSAMEYRASFIMTTVGQLLSSCTMFFSIYFLMDRFRSVDGYTLPEVLLCFSVGLTSFSISECFFRGFDRFSGIISDGSFDRILVRPRNEIFQVLCTKVEFSRLGRLVFALVVLFYSVIYSGILWTFSRLLVLFLMIAGGAALFSSLFLIYAGICFFTLSGLEFMNIFTDGGRELAQYPLGIYGRDILRICTFVVPLACAQFYPLLYLTQRESGLFYPLSPLICFVFALPCLAFWRCGLSHYKSTGS